MLSATNKSMVQPFGDIAEKYDLLNDFMSLGLHRAWKRTLVEFLSRSLTQTHQVLDLATGTGDVASLFLNHVPAKQIYGADPCQAMMDQGKKRFSKLTHWVRADAESLPFKDNFFKVVTCTFGVRNFHDRSLAFREVARVLEVGGRFGVLEIHPIPRKWRYLPFHFFWKVGIPLWGRLFKRLKAYEYLRDSAAQFISPEVMVEELRPFFDVEYKKALVGGGLVTLIIAKKR